MKPGMIRTPRIQAIMAEGDELAQRMGLIKRFVETEAFKELAPLDAHLLTLQVDAMQTYLHILTIRLARTSDAEKGKVADSATALAPNRSIIKPN